MSVSNDCNLVEYFLVNPFSALYYEDELIVKNKRPTQELKNLIVTGNKQNRSSNSDYYKKYIWLTGSEVRNKLFSWYCVLISTDKSSCWGRLGYKDLKNWARGLDRHCESQEHISSSIKFRLTGKQNVIKAIDLDLVVDKVDHNIMINIALDLLKTYSENRVEYFQIDDPLTEAARIGYRVPQGTIFGPVFFSIHIKNVLPNLKGTGIVPSLAGDTVLQYESDSWTIVRGTAGKDLSRMRTPYTHRMVATEMDDISYEKYFKKELDKWLLHPSRSLLHRLVKDKQK